MFIDFLFINWKAFSISHESGKEIDVLSGRIGQKKKATNIISQPDHVCLSCEFMVIPSGRHFHVHCTWGELIDTPNVLLLLLSGY